MNRTNVLKRCSIVALFISSASSHAYSVEGNEAVCKKPYIREFSLPIYQEPEKAEVAPESEFTFTLSAWTNPETIKLQIKGKDLPYTLESNSSFHRVRAKIPAELTGQFARIDATGTAVLGCYNKEGWLIKIADKT